MYTRGYGNQSGRCGEMIDCDLDNLQWYNRICVYFTRKGGGGNHVAFKSMYFNVNINNDNNDWIYIALFPEDTKRCLRQKTSQGLLIYSCVFRCF